MPNLIRDSWHSCQILQAACVGAVCVRVCVPTCMCKVYETEYQVGPRVDVPVKMSQQRHECVYILVIAGSYIAVTSTEMSKGSCMCIRVQCIFTI